MKLGRYKVKLKKLIIRYITEMYQVESNVAYSIFPTELYGEVYVNFIKNDNVDKNFNKPLKINGVEVGMLSNIHKKSWTGVAVFTGNKLKELKKIAEIVDKQVKVYR